MLAGLLDEGAGPLDSAAFHQALEDQAIELSFSADRDAMHGRMKTLSRNAERAFELLGFAVAEARLEAEAVERVRGQVAASLRRELNDPDQAAARLFRAHSYPNHPYGQPVKGDLAILPTLTRDDLVTLRSRHDDARQSKGRRRRRDRRRDPRARTRPRIRRAAGKRRSHARVDRDIHGYRHPPRRQDRRSAIDDPLWPSGIHARRSGL